MEQVQIVGSDDVSDVFALVPSFELSFPPEVMIPKENARIIMMISPIHPDPPCGVILLKKLL